MAMTERERLEDKLQHLSRLAQRYSIYDPKYLAYHAQIDEALTEWQMEVVLDGVV